MAHLVWQLGGSVTLPFGMARSVYGASWRVRAVREVLSAGIDDGADDWPIRRKPAPVAGARQIRQARQSGLACAQP